MHNRKKLNIGISSLILGALFLEFNVSQVKADNLRTDSNYSEQTNAKVINQNVGSKDNVIDQKSADNSKFKTSLVLSSNNQNALLLDKKLVESQKTNTVKNGDQKSANAVKLNTSTTPQWLPASLSLYSVKNDNTNKWRYNSNIKTWSYIKSDGTRAIQEWVKTTDGQWYYFDKNGNMVTDGYFDTYLGNGKWKKYYFDRDGHYYQI